MDWDDIVYLLLLLGSIGFGHVFRQIEDPKRRKNVSTLLGFSVVLLTSGLHVLHPILSVFVNWIIISRCSKKRIHIISFIFSFLYLFFFRTTGYFGIPFPPAHTNLIQMILTLKLVGLAYELHDSLEAEMAGSPNLELECSRIAQPSLLDMFHYSFCYIGVLTGPYFSYRSYWDLFNSQFGKYARCLDATIQRFKFVPLYAIGFLVSSYYFPLKYAQSDAFYVETSLAYRLFFVLPVFFAFRMRMYIGMRLSECVFTMSGLGAYPTVSDPKPGKGPSKNYTALVAIAANEDKVKVTEYSFDTIYNMEPYNAEFDYTVRTSMKAWNMTVQYWLASYVHKRFPIRAYRMPVTFLVSSLWHGMHAGHYMCLCSVPFYLPIEDMYIKNFNRDSLPPFGKKLCWLVAYTWRMFLMGYWSIAFSLLYAVPAFRFWSSIYFIPTLLTGLMYLFARMVFTKRKKIE